MSETITIRPTRTPTITALQGLLIAQAALQVLDLVTTYIALQGGAMEANPVSRAMIEGPGWLAYGAVKLGLAAAFLGLWPISRQMTGIEGRIIVASMSIFAVLMTAVIVNNTLVVL